MRVLKFGGSSVADRAQVEKVLAIVRAERARCPIVVVSSAHKGVTDALVDAARRAARGEPAADAVLARQRAVASGLGCDEALLAPLYAEIQDLLRGIQLVKELSPRSLDYISSFGERMSVRCIADFFTREGLAADAHDVWDLGFVTDARFGQARPLEGYEAGVRAAFAALPSDRVPIVTGFIGKNAAGEITTVGRNGSDLTATLLAAAIGAEEAQIWTDTDGVMTADPSVVADARNIPAMFFEEAAELAQFGSRVLQPATLLPAMRAGIPVRVLNTNRPAHPGTVIDGGERSARSARSESSERGGLGGAPPKRRRQAPNVIDGAVREERGLVTRVTSIAYKERQAVLTVTAARMFGAVGFLARVFDVLARREVVVDVVCTSEVSVSLTASDAAALEACVEELAPLGACRIEDGRTILAVVGQHLATEKGLGAEILAAVRDANVNVEMISYASGSISLQMVIPDRDIRPAVSTLHRVLFG